MSEMEQVVEVVAGAQAPASKADLAMAEGRLDDARQLYEQAATAALDMRAADPDGSVTPAEVQMFQAIVLLDALAGSAGVEALVGASDRGLTHLRAARAVVHEMLPGTIFDAVASVLIPRCTTTP